MRKNTREVMESWRYWKPKVRHASIWTDGNVVFSYQTPILFRHNPSGRWVFNRAKYSVTTTTHQNGIEEFLREEALWDDPEMDIMLVADHDTAMTMWKTRHGEAVA